MRRGRVKRVARHIGLRRGERKGKKGVVRRSIYRK
jgi:hypothetical protein